MHLASVSAVPVDAARADGARRVVAGLLVEPIRHQPVQLFVDHRVSVPAYVGRTLFVLVRAVRRLVRETVGRQSQ